MATELAEAERKRAISAHALYLANLLLLPGLAFVVLWWWRRRWAVAASTALRRHLDQAFGAALWSGGLIVLVSLLLVLLGDLQQPATWVLLILYFTVIHAALVLLGAYALSRAMAGLPCRYPLPGLWRQP
ncbi:hypothetical protein ACG97_10190 [Vogesella sp. EB]|uniref:hypothetical protein n=1 Tax=Vogesella sp. EB TaxID=1526735 RepID=UPI00064D3461|nr:hypothetical protein [Vogesella sp. EB]KMJ53019.1 hypothetical protein ACG97_10190 [Vogesella sp. EB]